MEDIVASVEDVKVVHHFFVASDLMVLLHIPESLTPSNSIIFKEVIPNIWFTFL